MTSQRTLFDNPNICRKSDPPTSRAAAIEIDAKLTGYRNIVELIIGRQTQPRTGNELAAECERVFGGIEGTYRKRLHELVRDHRAVECDARRCQITGKLAKTYKRATR